MHRGVPRTWHSRCSSRIGDWNLAAAYFFPLNAFGWSAFMLATRRYARTTSFALGVVTPLLLVQIGAWMGLTRQRYVE